jgi:serine/threonine protein kinase/tetratricopeptide (TPR) repeat protein
MTGRTLGKYRVQEKIGAGGMGEVYRALDSNLDRIVALKVLPLGLLHDDSARKRFRKEALTLSRLNHPNIATIFDFDTQDGVDFLVMELIPGTPLKTKIANGALPVREVVEIGGQLAEALSVAHKNGVVHRDLKPGNLMLTPEGRLKVLDFGLATLMHPEPVGDLDATRTAVTEVGGAPAGTLQYMSPEQLIGKTADERSDIWACGIVLYEMATGEFPFKGNTFVELSMAIVQGEAATMPAGLSGGIHDVIHRCLAKEPGKRFQNAREVQDALEAIHTGQTAPFEIPSIRKSRRAMSVAGAVAVLVALGAAAGWFFLHGRQNAKPDPVKRLAVLPYGGDANDPSSRAFGNGLIETLTTRLTQLSENRALEVIPASEMRGKGVSTLQQASQQFGANMGLEVTFETAGGMTRVTYILVDPKTHRELRGDTITASSSDPFALQDKVAESVVNALQITLRPEEQQALANHGTIQPAAYDFYLQGRGYLEGASTPTNIENAISVFNEALQRDPKYALAFAGLGESYWQMYVLTKKSEWVARAKSACEQSVSLKDGQSDGHVCLGLVFNGTGRYDEAVRQYQQAEQLDPTNDDAYTGLAYAYEKLGKLDEAEKTYKRAIAVRPNHSSSYNQLGTFYLQQSRYQEAAAMYSQVIALEPGGNRGYGNLGLIYLLQARYAEAVPLLERSEAIQPMAITLSNLATGYFFLRKFSDAAHTYEEAVRLDDHNYEVWGNLGDAYYWAPGMRDKAPSAYRRAISLAEESLRVNGHDGDALGYLAQYHAMLGERRQALAYSKRALAVAPHDPDVILSTAITYNQLGETDKTISALQDAVAAGLPRNQLRDTPNFDKLRADSRFQRLQAGPQ